MKKPDEMDERGGRDDRPEQAAGRIVNRAQVRKEKVRPSYLWVLGSIGGLLAACFVLSVQWKEGRTVARVEVEGAGLFSVKEVLARANVRPGSLIDTVSLTGVRARLESHPYIRAARVSRNYPDALRIEIEERMPVASFTARGSIRYVDADGVVLPYLESEATHDLPTITGVPELASTAFGHAVEGERFFDALAVLWAAFEADTSVYHLISEVDVSDSEEVTVYSTQGGVRIRLGAGDMPRKMALLRGFWDQFVRGEGPEKLEYLDLRFGDRVVAKWVDKPPRTHNRSSM